MYNNYYQNYTGYRQQYLRPRIFGGAIKNIIIANMAVFLFMTLFQTERFFVYFFGLVPQFVWGRGFVWQLFTYMFIHGGFGHIFMNMFVLWMFGSEIENAWGKREFFKFYFIAGIGSGIITLLFSLVPESLPCCSALIPQYRLSAPAALFTQFWWPLPCCTQTA